MFLVGALTGCNFDPPEAAPHPSDTGSDAALVDSNGMDAGRMDIGGMDFGVLDMGVIDTGSDADIADIGYDASTADTSVDGGVDASIEDTGYDAGSIDIGSTDADTSDMGVDAGIEDTGVADAGYDGSVDSGTDAGTPDVGCNPYVSLNDIQLQAGQQYCFNFSNNSTNVPAECGTTTPYAPGHGPSGPGTHGVVMPRCGRNLVDFIYEGDIFNSGETLRNSTGVFVRAFSSPPGMRTSALIVQDNKGEYGQDDWTTESQ